MILRYLLWTFIIAIVLVLMVAATVGVATLLTPILNELYPERIYP